MLTADALAVLSAGRLRRGRHARSSSRPDLLPNRPSTSRTQTSLPGASRSASWEIDLWGRIRRQTESAQANLLATDEARRGVILSLVAQVANNYLHAARRSTSSSPSRRRRCGTYDESLKLFELQFKYGLVSQMNVAQAQSQYETAAAQIPPIEQQIVQTRERAVGAARPQSGADRARQVGRRPGAARRCPPALPSQLLERRPDLLQAEQQLIAANAQIGAAKALYFPTISLTGAFGGVSTDLSNLFKGPIAGVELRRLAGRSDLHRRRGHRPGGAGRRRRSRRRCSTMSCRSQSAFADVENALIAQQKPQRAARRRRQRLVDALQRLLATGAAAVRRRLRTATRRCCRPSSSCFRPS